MIMIHGLLGGFDHENVNRGFTVSSNIPKQCINITITNDTELEEDEFFQLSITSIIRAAGNYGAYQLLNVLVTITIIDDDRK